MMLIYPDLKDGPVEVLPGQTVSSLEAHKWFCGEWVPDSVPTDSDPDSAAWREHGRLLEGMQKVDMSRAYVDTEIRLRSLTRLMTSSNNSRDEVREFETLAADYREKLSTLRKQMRALGMAVDDD